MDTGYGKKEMETWSNMSADKRTEKLQQELHRTQLMVKELCKLVNLLMSHSHDDYRVVVDILTPNINNDFLGDFRVYEG